LPDAATNSLLQVLPGGTGTDQLKFISDPAVTGDNPNLGGNAFNAGAITLTPIDGSFQSEDFSATQDLASLLGTRLGQVEPLAEFLSGSGASSMVLSQDPAMLAGLPPIGT
jgi:hypothetical protein